MGRLTISSSNAVPREPKPNPIWHWEDYVKYGIQIPMHFSICQELGENPSDWFQQELLKTWLPWREANSPGFTMLSLSEKFIFFLGLSRPNGKARWEERFASAVVLEATPQSLWKTERRERLLYRHIYSFLLSSKTDRGLPCFMFSFSSQQMLICN